MPQPNALDRVGPRGTASLRCACRSARTGLTMPPASPTSTPTRLAALLTAVLAGVVALAACIDDGSGNAAGPTIRDSAGITIVENTATLWPDGAGWRLPPEPVVDIGVLEGDPNDQLFQVSGAVRLGDGRIVVANAGTHQLRFYDSTGRYLASAGREGDGPGEFRSLDMLSRYRGDSLVVYDRNLRRITVFDSGGRFARSFQLGAMAEGTFSQLAQPFDDGSIVVSAGAMYTPGSRSGVHRDTAIYYRYAAQGGLLDTLGHFPGDERWVKAADGSVRVSRLGFGRSAQLTVFGNGLYFGNTDTYEVRRYSFDGSLDRVIRKAHTNLPVTAEHVAAYRAERLEGALDMNWRRFIEGMLADMPFPETMPAFEGLHVDAQGNLWVQEYDPPGAEEAPRWTVFDSTGAMLGTVETPFSLNVRDIGADFVLGTWHDEVDVEHVRLYRLMKE